MYKFLIYLLHYKYLYDSNVCVSMIDTVVDKDEV